MNRYITILACLAFVSAICAVPVTKEVPEAKSDQPESDLEGAETFYVNKISKN